MAQFKARALSGEAPEIDDQGDNTAEIVPHKVIEMMRALSRLKKP